MHSAFSAMMARPERLAGPYLWWLVGAAAIVALVWGWIALSGARQVLKDKPRDEDRGNDEIPDDRNPDLL